MSSKHDRTSTQSQGGIKHAGSAKQGLNPQAGSPKGAVKVPGPSLDTGGGDDPHDGRSHSGFSGDNGSHQAPDSTSTAASSQPGSTGDLGAQSDQRIHEMPEDPAERTSGADTPNAGGIEGSEGGPRRTPKHIPGESDEDGASGGGQSGNDPQRDSQI
jgi:hypothetical protein